MIDRSSSMGSTDSKPKNLNFISDAQDKAFDNRLGAVYESSMLYN